MDINTWFIDKFWPAYPKDLCQGKKGSKTLTLEKLKKYNPDEKERELIMKNMTDHIRYDRAQIAKGIEVDRWPLGQTYVHQKRFKDVLEGDTRDGEIIPSKLPKCPVEGCMNLCHGPNYPSCADHLASNENPAVIKKMREVYRDNGLIQREGESDKGHSLRLRKMYVKAMTKGLAVKDMDKYS